jgi:hypothetical protein
VATIVQADGEGQRMSDVRRAGLVSRSAGLVGEVMIVGAVVLHRVSRRSTRRALRALDRLVVDTGSSRPADLR